MSPPNSNSGCGFNWDGRRVGGCTGARVLGARVGLLDGVAVGLLVGIFVGANVGLGVGIPVGEPVVDDKQSGSYWSFPPHSSPRMYCACVLVLESLKKKEDENDVC